MHLSGKYKRYTVVEHPRLGEGVVLGYAKNLSDVLVCVVAWVGGCAEIVQCVSDEDLTPKAT